jgi:hypothetical protein
MPQASRASGTQHATSIRSAKLYTWALELLIGIFILRPSCAGITAPELCTLSLKSDLLEEILGLRLAPQITAFRTLTQDLRIVFHIYLR